MLRPTEEKIADIKVMLKEVAFESDIRSRPMVGCLEEVVEVLEAIESRLFRVEKTPEFPEIPPRE